MSDINTYYKSIISKVKKMINQKKYDDAIFILEDELETPYIPVEFQTELEDMLINISADKNYFEGLSKIEHLNRDQLLNKIFENNKLNSSAIHLFFERYSNNIKEKELLYFENVFLNRNLNNDEKTLLFEALAFQRIDYTFKFYNKNVKEDFEINPINTLIFEQIPLFKNSQKLIDDLASKEPSLLNFCFNILFLIYKYYFPVIPSFDYKELSKSIFNYMISTLQGEKIKEDEITKLIEKILA